MNSYLKKSIIVFIAAMAASNALPVNAYDTTIFDSVEVVGTPPPSDPPGGTDSGAGSPGTDGDSSGGGGGGGSEGTYDCDALRKQKPDNCPDPISYPTGYAFANDRLAGGTGIPKLIFFADHVAGISPNARTSVHAALARHTQEIGGLVTPATTVNKTLVDNLSRACAIQRDHDAPARNFGGTNLAHPEKKCLEAVERLTAESSGRGLAGWFADWLATNRLSLGDLGIPETVIGWLDPANSLKSKYDITTRDALCSRWWYEIKEAKCAG